ncbi:MAG: redoxin domain-containing protein [Planctomycetales bacterium]|nr:redoxin domain-containing protein [Planctomycetales bacterium]
MCLSDLETVVSQMATVAMLQVGLPLPTFDLPCVEFGALEPRRVSRDCYAGRWLVMLFYPRDFSFVCPTELTAFSARCDEFRERNCELLAVSIDSIESHRRWLATAADAGGVGELRFPLASDSDGACAKAFGVWSEPQQLPQRGLFIVDPRGIVQYAVVHNLSVGRNAEEVHRVLTALQTGGLCPANWTSADGTIDPERMLQSGRVVGHYRVERLLGQGSFATVFAATDLRLERLVALKVLHRLADHSRQSLLIEARAAAGVTHPNVCTIYAVEEHDGLSVIAMQCVDGPPLRDLIAKRGSALNFAELATRIADGLAAAHRVGVVHGDLKPANILVSADGNPSIIDFGLNATRLRPSSARVFQPQSPQPSFVGESSADHPIASPIDATMDVQADAERSEEPASFSAGAGTPTDLTDSPEPGAISGTPAYMSPEQSRGFAPTSASDVFSLGLVFFEMLTGRRAIDDSSVIRVLSRLQQPQLASDLTEQIDASYQPLLFRMLQLDPIARPTAAEVREWLVAQI